MVTPILNTFVASIGYFILGQTKKVIAGLILWLVGVISCRLPALIITIFVIIDALGVTTAPDNGDSVDEHAYKFGLLYKIAKLIHKEAVFKD
ncbi:MAG TPA: hypothetical protein DCR55_15060 [Lentisphaeria bacterium]|nr:hypothetical protein [Lentisphaeria bacterium]